jgi:hypothetical protein
VKVGAEHRENRTGVSAMRGLRTLPIQAGRAAAMEITF